MNMTTEGVQELLLSLLGIPYVLGAEVRPGDLANMPATLPKALDCSELTQLAMAKAGHPEFGDLAAAQWAKCTPVARKSDLPLVGGIVVLHNNPGRLANVGHIGMTVGRTPNGIRRVVEARGRAWGTVVSDLDEFLARGRSSMGIYEPLRLDGYPVPLWAWRNGPRTASTVEVQTMLNAAGHRPALRRDGDYGPKTVAAVRQFQTETGRYPSGAVTVPTRNALRARTR